MAGLTRFASRAALVIALIGAGPAAAQRVDGVLIDEHSGRPLSGAFLSLIDEADVVHDTTTTDRSGRFTLAARDAGSFVIVVERDAYASVTSDAIPLRVGTDVSYTMEVPPLSLANMRQISETLDRSERLRTGLGDLCRGRLDPVSGGVLVGVVRDRATREPVSGVTVRAETPDARHFTAVTDGDGVYLFCFVPTGRGILVTARRDGWRAADQDVEVRPGTISWYDFRLSR